ncbi:winged helix-turn-helix domain-containing protein [Bradyrhizobium sp. JYMT SZCCT0428]|uniref:ATP-binding protein n=1 Tax=Bradyrhizobium sp. JYMT SZCCT0428 TaxID=2807673 RepID=UPI001BA97D2D|nr:winged helix-turn-helix domain-containing protein [Bradyrhizobium sp. JYMT SZCCT0428]MBR1153988.1 winged helix-turn-helix domain-containing protein [Bradyrhizobium sp. JYMT SZCCT0428]
MSGQNRKVLSFGPFELSIGNRLLTSGTKVVPLGGRAMDILIVLVEQASKVVSRRTLIERVWPKRGAGDVSLRVHISALRKALAQNDPTRRYVANVPGRGYSFVVPLMSFSVETSETDLASRSRLPARLARMVGRKDVIDAIQAKLAAQKFVTIVGPGGIGKTSVAVAVAHEMRSIFDGRVRFVDLSTLGDTSLVAPAVASSFGLAIQTNDVVPALIDHLLEAPTLLVLDSCEHLIDGASALAEKLFCRVPTLHLLATTRETLRIEGENVHELAALSCPPDDQGISASRALEYPAVQLLVERVRAMRGQFELVDADAPIAAGICRRLDGIALAIELAACRVDIYGLGKTASLLDDHLNLTWAGRRTAAARHQTLNATLEWSYDLLDERERLVLSRLSVFSGGFTFEAAIAVVADDKADEARASDCVWELRSKSLIAAYGQESRLRLLDTTRAFALQRLAKSDEENIFRHRHALYFSDLFRQGAAMDVSGWPKALGIEVDNLRAALNWAFSAAGDAEIGIELAAASASTWMGMSLLTECREWMSKAISRLDDVNSGTRQEMVIQSALASCMMFTGGMTDESYATWAKTHVLAEGLKDAEHQLISLLVLWAHQIRIPHYPGATGLADRCGNVAERSGDRGAIAMANYMRGVTYHHSGRILEAEGCLELSLHRDDEASRQSLIKRFGYDRKADALGVMANLAWLRGSPDHARRLNRTSIAEARQLDHAVPLCVALTWASFNMYLTNPDGDETEALANELVEHAGKYAVESYHGFGLAMQALLRARRGEAEAAAATLFSGLEKLSAARYGVFNWFMQAELGRCMAADGRPRQALAVFEAAKINLDERQWYAPELLRIRGELALANNEGLAVGREYFGRALALSTEQASFSWALRAATSLVITEKSVGRKEAAWKALQATYGKFREGFDTFDLGLAKQVLSGSFPHGGVLSAGTRRFVPAKDSIDT